MRAHQWPLLPAAVLLVAQTACEGGLRPGDPAPPFQAPLLASGESRSLADYRGSPLLLNIWATWCAPCKREMPELNELARRYEDRGLRVVGVSVDAARDVHQVRAFVREMEIAYDILLDDEGDSLELFGARGLPTTVFIDRAGRLVFRWLGEISTTERTFLEVVEGEL